MIKMIRFVFVDIFAFRIFHFVPPNILKLCVTVSVVQEHRESVLKYLSQGVSSTHNPSFAPNGEWVDFQLFVFILRLEVRREEWYW